MKNWLTLALVLAVCSLVAVPAFAGEDVVFTVAPEPATMALLAAGIGGVAVLRKVRQKK